MTTTADDTVAERLVHLALTEAVTPLPADLEARIVQCLERRIWPDAAPQHRSTRTARLAVAALMLLGVGVVFAFAVLAREPAGTVATQDPAPKLPAPAPAVVKITDGHLPARIAVEFTGRPMHDVLLGVAKQAKLPYVSCVTGIDQAVTRSTNPLTPRAALATGAHAAGAHVEQHGAVLTIVAGTEPEAKPITLQLGPTPAHDLFAAIAARCHVNLVVAAAVTGTVEVDVKACHWRDLVEVAASALGAETFGCGGVLAIVPKNQVPAPRTNFAFEQREAARVIDLLAKMAGLNVVVDPTIPGGEVTVACTNQRSGDVLRAVAAARAGRAEHDGRVWRCGKGDAPDPIVLTTKGPIELARAMHVATAPRSFTSEHALTDPVSVFCELAPRRHVLDALAHTAGGRVDALPDGFRFAK